MQVRCPEREAESIRRSLPDTTVSHPSLRMGSSLLFTIFLYVLVQGFVNDLPEGPPVPAGVKIRFAGMVDDLRKVSLADSPIIIAREVPMNIIIVRLTSGKYAMLFSQVSPYTVLFTPPCMVLSRDTPAFIVSESTGVLCWAHTDGGEQTLYEVTIRDVEPFEEFAGCFRRMSADAAADDVDIDIAVVEHEMACVYNAFDACINWGSFEDETTWGHVRVAYWRGFVCAMAVHYFVVCLTTLAQ
ncbi:uncharacterized protein C8Q71DRAFT_885595 [Rhodofomes roseus]|uniref:Uncharacterized protein n=1 Tax=Rhodofomes roseus TaxID=34475 RepID=A0ABQ8KT70_9APHY|nr:uncharacterized protein C8Q71DRAFT_885595 [Rhodofomes roseus]KAH9842031.1 hypothetical protein C8Q71DRAFT_885595 [Rhodofomes roseus]